MQIQTLYFVQVQLVLQMLRIFCREIARLANRDANVDVTHFGECLPHCNHSRGDPVGLFAKFHSLAKTDFFP